MKKKLFLGLFLLSISFLPLKSVDEKMETCLKVAIGSGGFFGYYFLNVASKIPFGPSLSAKLLKVTTGCTGGGCCCTAAAAGLILYELSSAESTNNTIICHEPKRQKEN
jgi:hypothetical protein